MPQRPSEVAQARAAPGVGDAATRDSSPPALPWATSRCHIVHPRHPVTAAAPSGSLFDEEEEEDAPPAEHSSRPTRLRTEDVDDEEHLPWQQLSSPPRLSPREKGTIVLDDEEASPPPPPTVPRKPVRCCDVCEAVYSGAVCRCLQLALTHPVAKILARHRASIELAHPPDRSPKRCRSQASPSTGAALVGLTHALASYDELES